MADQAAREIIEYEYQFEDTPRFCVMDDTWELYDIFPSKWNPRTKVLVFRRELSPKQQGNDLITESLSQDKGFTESPNQELRGSIK